MTIPNLITLARLLSVPVLVVVILNELWWAAFGLFALAGVSDAVDGYIARRYGMRSELGSYLDPAADKALLVSIYVTLAFAGVLPAWLAVVVVFRDVVILAAIMISRLMDRPMSIRPLFVSKLNTAAQIAFAALALGVMAGGDGPAASVMPWGMATVATLTVLSAAAYLARWLRHMAG